MRQGKDTMVIRYRQQILQPGINPSSLGSIIATRTMAVATGVIPFLHMTAGITDLPVSAELSTPAMLYVVHDFVLPGMQSVVQPELVAILSEDITESRTGCRFIGKRCMAVVCFHRLSEPRQRR